MSHLSHPRTAPVPASRAPRSAALLLAAACVLPGCRGPRVLPGEAIEPTFVSSAVSPADLLHAANATPRAVSSFSAAVRLALVTPDGETVNLDGALIAAEPGSLRLQAWKFDRPALDLTVTPAGRFLFVHGQEGHDAPDGFASIPPGGLPTLAPLLSELPELGYEARWLAAPESGNGAGLHLHWPAARFGIDSPDLAVAARLSPNLQACVEWMVLRPRESGPPGEAGPRIHQVIRFGNFRSLGGIAWPMDWTLVGHLNGTLLLEGVELNPQLPASAFEPPANAVAF